MVAAFEPGKRGIEYSHSSWAWPQARNRAHFETNALEYAACVLDLTPE